MDKPILDPCCGGKMFYFDKNDPRVLFMDCRQIEAQLKDRGKLRQFEVKPDIVGDFTCMEFADGSFRLVVFDPPPPEVHGIEERGAELADGEVWVAARPRLAGDFTEGVRRVLPRAGARWRPDLQVERDRHQGVGDSGAHAAQARLRPHQRQAFEHALDMFHEGYKRIELWRYEKGTEQQRCIL